jgi:hypothetical protein
VDLSPAMIARARKLALGVSNPEFRGLPGKALDLVLRTFQPDHVHFNRARELEALLESAGLGHRTARWLADRSYVITKAAKP